MCMHSAGLQPQAATAGVWLGTHGNKQFEYSISIRYCTMCFVQQMGAGIPAALRRTSTMYSKVESVSQQSPTYYSQGLMVMLSLARA